MTMSKHTRGPWRVEINLLRDGHLAIVAGDYGIAKVWNADPGNNCRADAYLIAAAPDIFDALVESMDFIIRSLREKNVPAAVLDPVMHPMVQKIDAVLTKAKGL